MRRPWRRSSGRVVRGEIERGRKEAATYLLVNEHSNNQNRHEEDDDENENDTGLALSPVVTLCQLVESVLAASDEGHVDGGHCECEFSMAVALETNSCKMFCSE
jgi:hypothetical protein